MLNLCHAACTLLSTSPCTQGWGSGAGKGSDVWHEVFAAGTSSQGLIVDRLAAVSEQTHMLAHALEWLVQIGKQHTGQRPLMTMDVGAAIDLDTDRLDNSTGVVISLKNYW